MSFLKRLFSADYRAAVSAEAAGQFDQAAERYVLAGEHTHAARVHLARAERADSRAAEVAALRDALHWAGDDPDLEKRIQRKLGRTLLARILAEGVATQRDKDKVRQAAAMLLSGGEYLAAGEAFESIDDVNSAARAYRDGGLVERMEAILGKDDERLRRERALRDSFANYELHMRLGNRDLALADLRQCVEEAEQKSEYRRLLDDLESRLITGGLVVLTRRQGAQVSAFAGAELILGRDPLCEWPLRTGGVSRRHAAITIAGKAETARFQLADAGSRNGTLFAGIPIAGAVPLHDKGQFSLGEHCTVEYRVAGQPAHLTLSITSGLDRGRWLVCGGPDELLDLRAALDLPIAVELRRGRPFLIATEPDSELRLGSADIVHGAIQLIHGDGLLCAGNEVEVA